ncbi:MAG TPA: ribbon-helix-helix protein, CopG family [Candidatus Baltobacteraceae bacterium]
MASDEEYEQIVALARRLRVSMSAAIRHAVACELERTNA